MGKLFTTIIILFLACSFVGIQAQGMGSASTQIIVNILPGVEVSTISDLTFGSVGSNTGVSTLGTADDSAGRFLITGAENAEITIDFSAPSHLTGHGDHAIPFTSRLAYTHSASALSGDYTEINPDSPPSLRLSPNTANTSTGSVYISVSGSIDVGHIPAGTYSGIVTLSATYN
ncbi:MAG: hypothetical protein LC662_02090 [Rhodothermaceae bacterium]|nr:hypothetical protein [Rhodothermaceae bacterium]